MITFEGFDPSSVTRHQMAEDEQPVLLAFSRGKDSVAAWLALIGSGVEVIPFHLYRIPGINFEQESIRYFEEFFETPILQYPHPWLYRALAQGIYQPPERVQTLMAADLLPYTYEDLCAWIIADQGLPSDTWIAEGVRACDSAQRRLAMKTHGAFRETNGIFKASVIWDWSIADVREMIAAAEVNLPVDYQLFGRSFDGIDLRFMGPLREHLPRDFEVVREWFPLIDLCFMREELSDVA